MSRFDCCDYETVLRDIPAVRLVRWSAKEGLNFDYDKFVLDHLYSRVTFNYFGDEVLPMSL